MKDTSLILKELKAQAEGYGIHVAYVCSFLLSDPKLLLWTGSPKSHQHHYGKGGLINHLSEVVNLCLKNREIYPEHRIDEKELFMAALFHDAGKLFDRCEGASRGVLTPAVSPN